MTVVGATMSHKALLHHGPDDLARRAAPDLREALARGDALHVSLTPAEWAVLSAVIGPSAGDATVLPAPDRYTNPGAAMASLHSFVGEALAAGAPAVWSIGSVQIDGDPERDARWARYESAVDHVLADVPFHGICAYDARESPHAVIDMVRRCHTMVDDPERGLHPCPDHLPYEHAAAPWPHRNGAPDLELWDVEPAAARAELTRLCDGVLGRERLGDLHLVATELLTNGMRHGDRPIALQAWASTDGVTLEVWDHGPGIAHPYADLLPHRGGAAGGHGLWLVGQLSDQVSIGREDGRTVVIASLRPTD